jgi:primosomal protein N' (replication factor Y)
VTELSVVFVRQILDELLSFLDRIVVGQWIASYYMCAIGDVYRGAMPSALLLESETIISQKTDVFVDESTLSDDEFLIFQPYSSSPRSKFRILLQF